MLLIALILVPLLFALAAAFAPAKRAFMIALAGTLAAFAISLVAFTEFDRTDAALYQLGAEFRWIPEMGLNLSVGVDSVALLLILLTTMLGPICVVASKTAITDRPRVFYSWLLILQAAMTGVFAARDLVLFYICFEFTLVPMFILISLYGSTNRKKAAVKFFLYTFTGSIIALAGLIYVAWKNAAAGQWSFDIGVLTIAARNLPPASQALVLLALFCGFAVKVPLFPVHTWLPLAHTEAPTAGSVILAGVLLKLGTYGLYRLAIPFAPAAFVEYAPLIGTLCVIGILYGGLICWVQTDVKKLVAYSSVAHLGFCVLGLAALNQIGLTGSILYMINHGLSTGALFLLIGMVYERYHTRNMKELGGLAAKMPIWAFFMVFFTMASVGLPGLNGFVSEFFCLLAAFQADSAWGSGQWGSAGAATPGATPGDLGPWFAAIAGIGMIIAAMYLLYMVGKVVFGPLVLPHHGHGHDSHGEGEHHTLPTDLSPREIGVLVPLAALCIFLGVYPRPVLDMLQAPVKDTIKIVDAARSAAGTGRTADAAATIAEEAAQ